MTETNTTESEEKVKKPLFDLKTALAVGEEVIALDEKDRLTAVPLNWTSDYRRLQRSNFVDKGHFYEWQVALEEQKIARINERIEELREAAEEAREGPDPIKKNTKKLVRMLKSASALQAQLLAEGVDLSQYGIEMDEDEDEDED